MSKKFIVAIILLLALSLAGALILQALWINDAWKNKREAFDRDVKDAMSRVAQRLETQEAATYLNRRFNFGFQPQVYLSNNSGGNDTGFSAVGIVHHSHIEFRSNSTYDLFDTLNKQSETFMVSSADSELHLPAQRMLAKSQQLNSVLNSMMLEWSLFNVPIEKRVDISSMHKLIQEELAKKSIHIPFQFGVMSGNEKAVIPVRSSNFSPDMVPAAFSTFLFPNDITYHADRLLVFFEDVRPYFLRSLWGMVILSLLMTLIFTGAFGTAIYAILRQKKLSEIKTDFINNMTHEFKTPIATISIALDSINNPKVLENKERIHYYTDIIGRENERMNNQVEHILQIALLDKENFELNEQLLNVHDLIQQIADSVVMQVEGRNGRLKLNLEASNPYVLADEIHLTNVIYNLLDNANKYSPSDPEITINTKNEREGIVISVEDHGIGMNGDTQKRIFEKFYREQGGNVHNVKGFGLGLAYVKSIIRKHKGNITVKSEPGKGTRLDIFLPYGHLHKDDALIAAS